MNYLMIGLRLFHILSGVFWVGSSVMFYFFLTPTVAATAESGQKFMGYLVNKARVTMAIMVSAILTVLAGLSMYWLDSNGLTSTWTTSSVGVGFGIGGLFGLIGLGLGMQVGRNAGLLARIGSEVQGKPTPEQMAGIQSAQRKLGIYSPTSTVALILALICMATARYWRF